MTTELHVSPFMATVATGPLSQWLFAYARMGYCQFLPEHPAEHSKHSNIDIRLTSFGGPCCLMGWARRSFEGEK
jgi:hypothetical protein